MILTRSEIGIQLTYTPEEYEKFNDTVFDFKNKIPKMLIMQIPDFDFRRNHQRACSNLTR